MSGARHIAQHRAPAGTAAHLHETFFVVTAITNTRRFRTRYELYDDFADRMAQAGVQLYTIECAYGNRKHAVTDAGNPWHIQLRTPHELWHKENLINIANARVTHDHPEAKYLAWIDADTAFTRPDWVNETVQMLQHHQVVQMFSQVQDLGPDYQLLATRESFARSYLNGEAIPSRAPDRPGGYYGYDGVPGGVVGYRMWHPGLAWAWRREALDAVGGLIDWAIVGAGDFHMAWSLIGEADFSLHPKMHGSYRRRVKQWERDAEDYLHRDIGFVDGTILHYFHGPKINRDYWDRWRILVDNEFNPDADIKPDATGVYQLQEARTARRRAMRDGLRLYFRSRDEDDPRVE